MEKSLINATNNVLLKTNSNHRKFARLIKFGGLARNIIDFVIYHMFHLMFHKYVHITITK